MQLGMSRRTQQVTKPNLLERIWENQNSISLPIPCRRMIRLLLRFPLSSQNTWSDIYFDTHTCNSGGVNWNFKVRHTLADTGTSLQEIQITARLQTCLFYINCKSWGSSSVTTLKSMKRAWHFVWNVLYLLKYRTI